MKNWIFSVLLLCGDPAMAQIQFNSIKEVLNYADAHAVALKSAAIGEQIAVSEKKEARSALLPALNLSLGYNDNITLQPTLVPAQIFNPAAPEGALQELTFGTKYIYSRGMQIQWDALNFKKFFKSLVENGFDKKSSSNAFTSSQVSHKSKAYALHTKIVLYVWFVLTITFTGLNVITLINPYWFG